MRLSFNEPHLFGIYYAINITKEVNYMDRAKMKLLVSILMDSPLYLTLSHEERLSLLFALTKEYPYLSNEPSLI